jgi:predicted DNA-binding transcriptional regulator AlpA
MDKSKLSETEQLLLSRKQVARLLGNISVATLRRLEKQGRLRGVRLSRGTGSVFFRVADIHAFIEEAK